MILRPSNFCAKAWHRPDLSGDLYVGRNIAISPIDTIAAVAGRHRSGTAFGKFGIAEYLGPQGTLLRSQHFEFLEKLTCEFDIP